MSTFSFQSIGIGIIQISYGFLNMNPALQYHYKNTFSSLKIKCRLSDKFVMKYIVT